MIGITTVILLVLLACAVTGLFARNRVLRILAWLFGGICLTAFLLFVLLVLPRLLQR